MLTPPTRPHTKPCPNCSRNIHRKYKRCPACNYQFRPHWAVEAALLIAGAVMLAAVLYAINNL